MYNIEIWNLNPHQKNKKNPRPPAGHQKDQNSKNSKNLEIRVIAISEKLTSTLRNSWTKLNKRVLLNFMGSIKGWNILNLRWVGKKTNENCYIYTNLCLIHFFLVLYLITQLDYLLMKDKSAKQSCQISKSNSNSNPCIRIFLKYIIGNPCNSK